MSQFGGSSDGGFDFYAPPRTSGPAFGSGPNSQFGGIPAGQPAAPAAATPWDYTTPPAPQAARPRRWPYVLLALVVLLGLLAVGGVMNIRARHREPVVLPPTLAGLAAVSDPSVQASLDMSEVQAQHPGWASDAQAYGSKKGIVLLFVARGPVKPDREFADFSAASGMPLVTPQPAGSETTCKSDATQEVTYCVRTSMFLTVEVAGVGVAPAKTAAAVDEAWQLQ